MEAVLIAFITNLALRRRSVTVLAVILVLASGIFTYSRLPVELFPEVDFPLVTVTTFYPSANPESVSDNVTISSRECNCGDRRSRCYPIDIHGEPVHHHCHLRVSAPIWKKRKTSLTQRCPGSDSRVELMSPLSVASTRILSR